MRTKFAISNNMKRISKCVGGGGEMKLSYPRLDDSLPLSSSIKSYEQFLGENPLVVKTAWFSNIVIFSYIFTFLTI